MVLKMADIRIYDHTHDEELKLEGMKELLRKINKRKKLIFDNRTYARYAVDYNFIVDLVNEQERKVRK